MASSYTSLLGLVLPVQGELIGTWGDTFNVGMTQLLDTAIAGTTTLSTDANVTLTTTTGAANQARQFILNCTGARTAIRTITAPASSKAYLVINGTTGGFGVTIVGVGPSAGVTVAAGKAAIVVWNGTAFVAAASTDLADSGATTVGKNMAQLANPSAVTFPKFNADNTVVAESAATYRTSLGATTVGSNMFTLTSPSAIRYMQINADNTVTALDAATFRANIGAGTGGGSVTSVSGAGTVSGLTLSGTVTGAGSLTLGGTLSLTSGNVTTALGFTPYNSTNPSGYITSAGSISGSAGSVAWSGVTGKPTTVAGYGITDGITTGNIGSQSVNYATSAGNASTLGGVSAGSLSVNYATTAGSAPANGGTATYSTYVWSTSHPGSYYLSNAWDGTYWQWTSNHGAGVRVAYADSAGNASTLGGVSAGSLSVNYANSAGNASTLGGVSAGSLSVNYANSAGSANAVAWANVSGAPAYETGNWTPSNGSGVSFTVVSATYTRIGRLVTCTLTVEIGANSSVGNIGFYGLPYTPIDVRDTNYGATGNIIGAGGWLGNRNNSTNTITGAGANNPAAAIFLQGPSDALYTYQNFSGKIVSGAMTYVI